MEEKGAANKTWGKIGAGVLFIISCFVAMYVLTEFHGNIALVAIAAVLLMISAFLFLNSVFSDKVKQMAQETEVTEETSGAMSGEFQLKITKHMKEMENTQKEMVEVLKNQNVLLQTQIENLEHEIYMLSEKQDKQAKSIIKFNKENARQLAISERETLEHVMQELKKAIEDNAVTIPVGAIAEAAVAQEPEYTGFEPLPEEEDAGLISVLEEVSEEELFAVSDLPGDDEYVMPELPVPETEPVADAIPEFVVPEEPVAEIPVPEEIEIPEIPMEIPEIPEAIEIPEMPAEIEIPMPEEIIPEPVVEETPVPAVEEAPAPAANPLAGLSSSDPGAMMTPEDIAKLLEAMGN